MSTGGVYEGGSGGVGLKRGKLFCIEKKKEEKKFKKMVFNREKETRVTI